MKRITLAVAALALSASISSFAANPGSYVGLGLGGSRLNSPNIDTTYLGTYSYSESRGGLGARIFTGYNFNRYFGGELAYGNYSQSKYSLTVPGSNSEVTYNLQALSLVGKAYLPVDGSGFNFYALGGVALVNSTTKVSNQNDTLVLASQSTTTRKVLPQIGGGISVDVNSQITSGLEYSHIQGSGDLKTSATAITDADMLTLNLAYKFD